MCMNEAVVNEVLKLAVESEVHSLKCCTLVLYFSTVTVLECSTVGTWVQLINWTITQVID